MTRNPTPAGRWRGRIAGLSALAMLLCATLACVALRVRAGTTTTTRELLPSSIQVIPGSFAFLRAGQVYLGRANTPPRQLTRFAKPDPDPTHAGPLVWAPDNRHLAVAIGSPLVARDALASATGKLYVADTTTGVTTLVAPLDKTQPGIAVGPDAYAWSDKNTLLYATAGQLFTYRLDTRTSTAVPGMNGLVLDLEVRGHLLYYMSYQPPDGPLVVLPVALRRHNLATNADDALADLGQVQFEVTGCNTVGCQAAPGVPSLAPAWDVSPDGTELAYERITSFAPDLATASASFWFAALPPASSLTATPTVTASAAASTSTSGAPQPIFHGVSASLPAGVPGTCCFLRFGPDGRGLVLSSGGAMPMPFGPYLLYTHALAGSFQAGTPWAFGPAAWAPDATSFTLVLHHRGATTTDLLSFASQRTTVLQDDAYGCAWANTLDPITT